MSDPNQSDTAVEEEAPLTEADLRQLQSAFAQGMRSPSTAPQIMMRALRLINQLHERVRVLEAKQHSDLSNI